MTDNLLENFTGQAKNFYEPLTKINQLLVANMQKVAEFQMDAMKSYAELTMKQFKELAEVRDLESLKNYGSGQTESASSIGKKIMEDLKTLGEMGSEFKNEVEKIINAARTGEVAEEAPKTGAKAKSSTAQTA
ncbi:MAG: phasin family protein [Hahellaceae bacterium]|nr:phasin family protein [Hahellaceae bacterium]MCP5212199.1 phasin family protein [Hahellaceae bacterium]